MNKWYFCSGKLMQISSIQCSLLPRLFQARKNWTVLFSPRKNQTLGSDWWAGPGNRKLNLVTSSTSPHCDILQGTMQSLCLTCLKPLLQVEASLESPRRAEVKSWLGKRWGDHKAVCNWERPRSSQVDLCPVLVWLGCDESCSHRDRLTSIVLFCFLKQWHLS